MKKKILITVFILFIAGVFVASAVYYLNNVFLPQKIKSLLVSGLKEKTGKEVSLGSLRFNIFKGLVLSDFKIYDNSKTLLEAKEASCSFLIFPILHKQIVIPGVSIKNALLFLNRRSDGTFNIADLLPKEGKPAAKADFNIFLRKIRITDSRIRFQDDMVKPSLNKDIDIKKAIVYLSLPADVKFQAYISHPVNIKVGGVYHILREQFSGRMDIGKFSPQDFAAYYSATGLKLDGGTVEAVINVDFQDKVLDMDITGKINALGFAMDKAKTTINSLLDAKLEYNTENKQIKYSAELGLTQPAELLLEGIGKLSNLTGKLYLNASGEENSPPVTSFDILTGLAQLDKVKLPFSNISGHVEFIPDKIRWSNLAFKYQDTAYKTEGVLTDFKSPSAELNLVSQDLDLDARFSFKDKFLTVSKLYGHYLHSAFALTGVVNTADINNLYVRVGGNIKLELEDLTKVFKNNAKQLETVSPKGLANINLKLTGAIKDIKSCLIDANISAAQISLYGLKGQNLFLNYKQDARLASIPLMHLSLYGGGIDASARMNINASELPYWISASMQGIKLQELKLDTAAKKQDIAGSMQGEVKLNGFGGDISKLSGAGKIFIQDGKLWELNFFQGFGKLIFAKDFSSIVFKEGSADFDIADKYVTSNNIALKGDFMNLTGACRIGFDGSLDAAIDVDVSELAPVNGTFKDVTTAIISESCRFGTIKITGSLKEPKYKFSADVVNILDTLKNVIIKNIQR